MGPAELAILKTVVYADLFDYPLRFEELCRGLFDLALEPDEVRRALDESEALAGVVVERDGFVLMRGREGIVKARREGELRARELLARYRGVLGRVARLPYVRLVALSGAVAFDNVHDDDVDVFVIARAGRAWSACLLVTLLTRALGARRAICANYFLDEGSLALTDRDLYTAHQAAHLRPVAGRAAHRAFVAANAWVGELFPAAYTASLLADAPPARVGLLERLLDPVAGRAFEAVARGALSANLRRKIPPGTDPASVRLGPGRLKLHINDHRSTTIARFERALDEARARAEGPRDVAAPAPAGALAREPETAQRAPRTQETRDDRPHASVAGWRGAAKRAFDVAAALAALVVLAPLLVAVAALVAATSRGPVLYRQRRLGLGGRTFDILKFRTMVVDAEPDGRPVWATNEDPRCTRVGGVMRRFGIDELPQLWNVVKGDMSLVGPRPERPEFASEFARRWPRFGDRLAVRGGITGLAQVEGLRGDTHVGRRLACDLRYAAEWSFARDVAILARTVPALVGRRGARTARERDLAGAYAARPGDGD